MSFRSWLEEEIEWGGEPIPRWRAIRIFVGRGLVPFLKKYGYDLAYTEKDIGDMIATGLYRSRGKSCLGKWGWPGPIAPEGAMDEDAWHFYHTIGPDRWESFWERWGRWTDVDPTVSSRATDRRTDIEAAAWRYLSLDLSPQTQVLNEIMAGGDEEEPLPSRPGQQGVDSYLQDAEHNGWGGYRR